jgi:hypothetical protein
MIAIQCRNKTYFGPEEWNKLTRKQLLCFANCLSSNLEDYETKIRIAYTFSGLPLWLFLKTNQIQRWEIGSQFKFLFEENKLTRQLIPLVRIGLMEFNGPDDEMKNLDADEFAELDRYYSAFRKSNKSDDLDLMISVIYRKKCRSKDTGDVREPFNEHSVAERSETIAKLNNKTKYAILLHYIGVRSLMVKKHPHVFTKGENLRKKNFGWPQVFYNLAGNKLGEVKNVEKNKIWNLLYILEMNEVERIENERKDKTN